LDIPIWTSLLAGVSITLFLLLFSHRPARLPLTLPRYAAAYLSSLVVWGALLWVKGFFPVSGSKAWLQFFAGGLIFLTAMFCNYYLGNVSAGFRIEMLVNLAGAQAAVSLGEWMAAYGKGRGMGYFLENRLLATLVPWHLAVWKDGTVTLTRWGRLAGSVNRWLAGLFCAD
jgi:hypothetical protein